MPIRMRPLLLSVACLALAVCASSPLGKAASGTGRIPSLVTDNEKRDQLQDIVTWDEQSLFIRGERVMIFSGEIHPFRLPVPSLYLDLFQKVKALGLNTVSFYVDWALLEGKAGDFSAEGVFDLQPFFDAASKAGIYLIARPGPYINAEVSGGGFPGWLARLPAPLRTSDPEYLNATDNYMARVCGMIAEAQITNGGPVILVQPENEYTNFEAGRAPDGQYFQYVIDQARKAGIVVPLVNNDARPLGNNAPGTDVGSVDIYGHDSYPLGFDCANPTIWPARSLPTDFRALHLTQSPSTPYSIMEFQGGSFDPYGGSGFDRCAALLNNEFERVFYKNNIAAGVTIFNVYMIFGGTNWGNLGHPGGYTSYDYGAVIKEDRSITREKYSELKLEAQFLKVSPAYLTAEAGNLTVEGYSNNSNVAVTPLLGENAASFFVVRHSDYSSLDTAEYTLSLPTSEGDITIPQIRGGLQIGPRDSKVHVVDYPVGNVTLLYSTAEIFTWKQFEDKTVLLVYGGSDESHEMAVKTTEMPTIVEGADVDSKNVGSTLLLAWTTSETRRVVQVGHLFVYILSRNLAYNYWVPDLPGEGDQASYGTSIMNPDSLIVNGGYLVRSVSIQDDVLEVRADFNKTTDLEIIGVASSVKSLVVNGNQLDFTRNNLSNWIAQMPLADAAAATTNNGAIALPDLKTLDWTYVDSLPEVQPYYDDRAWPLADHTTTKNTVVPDLATPVSLLGSDYGFHAGTFLFRGRFTAGGDEGGFKLTTQGGSAFASSVWLNGTFLGSFANDANAAGAATSTYAFPYDGGLTAGATYVLTVLVDTTGLEENYVVAEDMMKTPRGILDYAFLPAQSSNDSISTSTGTDADADADATVVTWKITGNLGGEDYADRFRGPLNEGGLLFERQGYHIPYPPLLASPRSPFDGTDGPGVAFYGANLTLDLPVGDDLDIPISFVFDDIVPNTDNSPNIIPNMETNTAAAATTGGGGGNGNGNVPANGPYRAILYVNGFQYGRYVSNIGPQTRFPVPEGVLRYRRGGGGGGDGGDDDDDNGNNNWICLAIWALGPGGARVEGFRLEVDGTVVTTGRGVEVAPVVGPAWTLRPGAY